MVHVCHYRTLAPDTYFCPMCRQMIYGGRMIVVPVLDDEGIVAVRLWAEAARQALAHAVAVWQAVADLTPPSHESLRTLADRIRMECSRPAWERRLRIGPRWIVRAKRGARYAQSQPLVASRTAVFRPSYQALREMRRLGIHYPLPRANARRFRWYP